MSPLLKGRAKIAVATQEIVRAQAEALDAALAAGGDQLDADDVAAARQIIAKVGQRNALAGDHTVVALAGATGSGKSSLFNALAGQELAQIGATRPTTSTPSAAVWGDDPAGPLLDWLAVPRRHAVSAPSGEPTDEHGRVTRRPRAARPARLRLPGDVAPEGGRARAGALRRVRLGDRPAEVRGRAAPRRVREAADRALGRHARRPQPGRPAALGERRRDLSTRTSSGC